MKLPTATLSLLVICSIVNGAPTLPFTRKSRNSVAPSSQGSDAKNALKSIKPSLASRTKALLTGKPQPNQAVADIPNTNSVAVKNQDKQIFTVDKNKPVGHVGTRNAVYDAKNHSNPDTATVMKVSKTPGSYNPSASNDGNPNGTSKRERKAAAKQDQTTAQAAANRENGFNQRMGISAGKPVTVSNGHENTTYMPMKKLPGASLEHELQKPKTDPNYISSHTLLDQTKNAIDSTHYNGILHNNANVGNVMVTKDQGAMIGYGKATNRKPGSDPLKDHFDMVSSLNQMKDKKQIPPSRLDSYKHAVNQYQGQLDRASGEVAS